MSQPDMERDTIHNTGARTEPGAAPAARVLVVDDLEVNRDLLARRMQRIGHAVEFAENGEQALRQLRNASFDLVLLDITMPVMDGYQALTAMKADPSLVHIPVVMVSAIDELDSVVRCLQLGADDYLTKPFNPIMLKARVESSLAKKRLADQQQMTLRLLSRELEIGQQIQRGFLPDRLPELAGWQLAACCLPARQVSGDFYDAFTVPGGRLALVVADVCDKGVGAALYMALFRSLLRAIACQGDAAEPSPMTLERTIRFTNDYIATVHGRDNMFATVFMALLDAGTGRLDYVNAGHDAPILQRRDGGEPERLVTCGPALGVLPSLEHPVQSISIRDGDTLFACTDGVTEALGAGGEYGEANLLAALQAQAVDAQALVDCICTSLADHVGNAAQHDDITMLCLRAA